MIIREKWLSVRADGMDDGGDYNDVDRCSLSAILANNFFQSCCLKSLFFLLSSFIIYWFQNAYTYRSGSSEAHTHTLTIQRERERKLEKKNKHTWQPAIKSKKKTYIKIIWFDLIRCEVIIQNDCVRFQVFYVCSKYTRARTYTLIYQWLAESFIFGTKQINYAQHSYKLCLIASHTESDKLLSDEMEFCMRGQHDYKPSTKWMYVVVV